MIVHIANPIYDSVFKYLMEDERIAKTILSPDFSVASPKFIFRLTEA